MFRLSRCIHERDIATWLQIGAACLAAVLVIGALAAPGRAQAAWTTARTVSPVGLNAGFDADSHQVAIDDQGDALVVWRLDEGPNSHSIQARRRWATGGLGYIQPVSASLDASLPQVDSDSQGNAVIVWRKQGAPHALIQARRFSAGGSLGPIQTVSPSGQSATAPQVAVNPNGKAVLVWRRYDGQYFRIQARTRSAGGSLGPVKTLSPGGQNAYAPQVAINSQGQAAFVWERFFPDSHGGSVRIQGRILKAGGTMSAVQKLSPPPGPDQDAHRPRVGIDDQDKATFTWDLHTGYPTVFRDESEIQTRMRFAAGGLSRVRTISVRGGSGSWADTPQLAVNPAGAATFAWAQAADYTSSPDTWARGRSAQGALSPLRELSADDYEGTDPGVGIDNAGNAVLVWDRVYYDEQTDLDSESVAAQVRSSSGTFNAIKNFVVPFSVTPGPEIAASHTGRAAVAWQDFDGRNTVIRAAVGP